LVSVELIIEFVERAIWAEKFILNGIVEGNNQNWGSKNIRRLIMNTERNLKRTVWIGGSLLLFLVAVPLYAAAEQWGKQSSAKQKMQKQQQTAKMTARSTPLCSAKSLIGSDVRSTASMSVSTQGKMGTVGSAGKKAAAKSEMKRQAEKIGTVKELIFDDSHNRVDCVIVASQGEYYPVPWWAFSVRGRGVEWNTSESYTANPAVSVEYQENLGLSEVTPTGTYSTPKRPTLFLNITKEQLRRAPTITSISLERISSPALRQKIAAFYSEHPGTARSRWQAGSHPEMQSAKNPAAKEGTMQQQAQSGQMSSSSPTPVKAAELARASKVIGLKVQDPLYDGVHRIQNVLIDGRGGRLAFGLVSFGGFLGVGRQTAAVPWSALNISVAEGYARLDASRPTLEAAAVKNDYLQRLSERQYARQIYNDFGATPYWQVFGFVPGEETTMSTNPWQPGSTYNKNFDPSKVTTIEGTIESVSPFYPATGSAPGTCLNVKTKEGTSVTVYAGPQSFAAQKNIDLKPGSSITITGSKTTVNGKSVIIASELQVGGKTFTLRDQNGKPEWKTGWSQQQK
jgi:hypothetical protein